MSFGFGILLGFYLSNTLNINDDKKLSWSDFSGKSEDDRFDYFAEIAAHAAKASIQPFNEKFPLLVPALISLSLAGITYASKCR